MQQTNPINTGLKFAAGAAAGVLAASANAATIDLTPITGAVSAGDITAGVVAIGGVMAVVWVTVKAVKIVMGFLKSA